MGLITEWGLDGAGASVRVPVVIGADVFRIISHARAHAYAVAAISAAISCARRLKRSSHIVYMFNLQSLVSTTIACA
jgi:hypothetical protein